MTILLEHKAAANNCFLVPHTQLLFLQMGRARLTWWGAEEYLTFRSEFSL